MPDEAEKSPFARPKISKGYPFDKKEAEAIQKVIAAFDEEYESLETESWRLSEQKIFEAKWEFAGTDFSEAPKITIASIEKVEEGRSSISSLDAGRISFPLRHGWFSKVARWYYNRKNK